MIELHLFHGTGEGGAFQFTYSFRDIFSLQLPEESDDSLFIHLSIIFTWLSILSTFSVQRLFGYSTLYSI